jgi:hypothetical protein
VPAIERRDDLAAEGARKREAHPESVGSVDRGGKQGAGEGDGQGVAGVGKAQEDGSVFNKWHC